MNWNGLVSKETLDELEAQWLQVTDKWGTSSAPVDVVKCVAKTHRTNRRHLADCLHPDREPCFYFVMETRPGGEEVTVAVTGNGPMSEKNAAFIANALVFMPDLIRGCRAALAHVCPETQAETPPPAGPEGAAERNE